MNTLDYTAKKYKIKYTRQYIVEIGGKYPVYVKDVVQGYTYSHRIDPWFVLKNDIRDPKFGPDNPGWLFVRQKTDRT